MRHNAQNILQSTIVKSLYCVFVGLSIVIASIGCNREKQLINASSYSDLPGEEFLKNKKEEFRMNFPNYQQHKDSPQVSDEEYGIKIIFPENQRKITYKIDEVWPLYGVYSVNWELIEKFKGDIDSQVVIIVIDKVFKTVYFGRIIKEDLPVETEEIEEPTGGRVVSVQGYFNIDLKTQCRLPIQAGEYWVMAILPPMSSEILEIKILDQDKE